MKKKLLCLIAILLFAISSNLFSAPAYPYPITKKQSNGKTITFTLKGDEYIKWAKTIDDYTLLGNRQAEYVYAIIDEKKNLVPSNVLASNPEERTIEEKLFLNSIKTNLFFSQSQLDIVSQNRASRIGSTTIERTPTTGTPNFLVILVNYADVSFNSANIATMQNMISQANYTTSGTTGSVRDYFYDNSIGLLNANFTVVGPFTLSHNAAYYGANIEGTAGNDTLPQEMMLEATTLADASVNFADYDNDNDGTVDMVHVVYAGRGEHNGGGANAIWAHSWSFPYPTYKDGVLLYKYSCSPELQNATTIDGIGTICHEMGHVLGLPDFYDTDYGGSGGTAVHLGSWDLMASGNYNNNSKTPPYFSALERKMLGWANYNYITSTSSNYITHIADSAKSYRINLSSNEYLILENRQKKKWDYYIPSEGMLIFHADSNKIEARYNINTIPTDRGFFLEPSTGDYTNDSYNIRTPFPGGNNVKNYTTITTPSMRLKNGSKVYGKSLTNIRYINDSTIAFDFKADKPAVITNNPTNITTTSADLNGLIVHRGNSSITQKGFYWSLDSTTCNATSGTTVLSTATDTLVLSTINVYNSNATVYYRAFAKNYYGTEVGDIKSFILSTTQTISTFPWTNGFESGLTSWNTQLINGTINWTIGTTLSGAAVTTPYSGSKYAKFYYESYNADTAKLISPIFNFTNVSNPYLSYYYVNPKSGSDQNILKIYYRTSGISQWNLIKTLNTNITDWTKDTITLPNPSSTYQIAFEGINHFGYQIGIDEVSIISFINPTVTTNTVTSITNNSAQLTSTIISGTETILNKGFEWKLSSSSTWNIVNSSTMSYSLTGLSPYTTYNVRAFAITASGTTYGMISSFRTLHLSPIITTLTPSNITQTSAILNGNLTSGSETITAKGFEIKLNSSSVWTIINVITSTLTDTIDGLSSYTMYNVRAFVTTASGTIYGLTESFTTLHQPPTVTTNQAINITQTTATLNGTVTSGTEAITTKGFEWKMSTSSTWNSVNSSTLSYELTNLSPNTSYDVRAYAITASITTYGTIQSFMTLHQPPTVTTNQATNIAQTTVTLNATITLGTETIITKSFKYKEGDNSDWISVTATGSTNLSVNLSNLNPETLYKYRALVTTATSDYYGDSVSFTTLSHIPPMASSPTITNITQSSAQITGTITSGTETIVSKGFEWKLSSSSNWTVINNESLLYQLTDLSPNTSYDIRVFVTTSTNTIYGTIQSFTTLHQPPTVTTNPTTNISQTTAVLNGYVNIGTETIISKGFQYKEINNSSWIYIIADGTNSLSANISGLIPLASYQVYALVSTASGVYYGDTIIFNTLNTVPPTVTTNPINNITQTTAEISGVVIEGTQAVITKGFEWKETISSTWTVINNSALSYTLSNLLPYTSYDIRTFATTASGISYGIVQTFTTLHQPHVISLSLSNITQVSVNLNGTLTQGTRPIISKGFEWKENSSSLWTKINITDNNLIYLLQGLLPNTSYNTRAFVASTSDTIYSSIENFSTLPCITLYSTAINAEICQGDTYNLNGFDVSSPGQHTQTLQSINGCDSILTLNLTVNQPAITNLEAEICQGETYTQNGFNTSISGLHTLNLQTYKGCDSTVNLNLIINQPAITNLETEICQGETYTQNGFNTSISGLHTLNLQTYKGCDSTVNINLIINQPAITNLEAEICQGETYNLNGFNTSISGLHTLNLQTYKGCDSTVNLNLIINQLAITNLEAEICQGETYTQNGFNTSISGLHTLNLQTYKGCDSTVNLNLTVNQPAITNLEAEICQGETYNLNGFNENITGTYTQNLQTIRGCDSTVTLVLTVNSIAIPSNLLVESGLNYFMFSWQGDAETYIIYRNNDSIATVSDTSYQDNDLVIGTNYCYKIKAIRGNCESEISDEVCKIFSSLEDINITNLRVYPNPANNYIIIEGEGIEEIEVYNISGQKIYSEKVNRQETIKVNTSEYLPGTYSFKIIFSDGNVSNKKVIIAR
ncbi:MAG: M6 family metalloprotease domain-containing protein [Bacteroidales bacterium]|jgi:M6 family metalloprotease-like protein